MSLLDSEKKYWECLSNQHKQLVNLYDEIKSNICISIENREITKAIILRMKAYYETQRMINNFLNKNHLAPGSDFFVETVIFYLKIFFEKNNIDFEVHSERRIRPKRGIIKPDISIWKDNKVIAIIECKTQLGFSRDKWEKDFESRKSKLEKFSVTKDNVFLLIMTSENGPKTLINSDKIGKQYYILSSKWPEKVTEENIEIINPIEGLLEKLKGIWDKV